MRTGQSPSVTMTGVVIALGLLSHAPLLWAASPPAADQRPATAAAEPADDREDQIVANYLRDCVGKAPKNANCDKLRNDFVATLKEDLFTLGSTADRKYIPGLVRFFRRRPEIELRIDAAHAIGMIGPEDSDVNILVPMTNDPVPDVRYAAYHMIPHGKGKALDLLKERIARQNPGREIEKPTDAAKFSMPVAPDSVYLYESSDATRGRLSYVVRKGDAASFFKSKAKKGPFKWNQFKEQYRYQLKDEDEAMDQAQQAAGKKLESEQPPDPAKNMEAYVAYMQKLGSVSTQGSMGKMMFDLYQQNLYGDPTVYVLEERQIGQRSYPTKYAVVYQELAFKRPGYRLAWTTVPDDALKAAQVASLKEQKEEEAHQAASKKNDEAAKKREAELDSLTKKKDDAEKKTFKKGQSDLEKELGF